MPNTQLDIEQKTGTRISQAVGLALVIGAGALGAAAFLFIGSQEKLSTTSPGVVKKSATTQSAVDLTSAEIFSADPTNVTYTGYDQAVAETEAIKNPDDITITITTPSEGALVDDSNGNYLTAELNDPNHKVSSLYVRTFNDRYKFMIGWNNDTTAPYQWNTALSLYPSGEYRDVIYARDAAGNFLAWTDVMYTKTHNCYYLGYQDMTLTAPTDTITAGKTFTMTASVKNNIRGACQNNYAVSTTSPLSLDSLLPEGWTATTDPDGYMSIGIGETRDYTVSVKVPVSATTGTYTVGVTSQRQNTGFIVTKEATVNVAANTGGGGGGGIKIDPGDLAP